MKIDSYKTIDEMAAALRVPKSWIYRNTMRTDKGAIPRIKIGKHLRFDPEAVEQWIMKRQG